MELRFQHSFLKNCILKKCLLISTLATLLCSTVVVEAKDKRLDINNEVFELGITVGALAIQDFNTEPSLGINATFNASEDFFLQLSYLFADASRSSFEASQGQFFEGSDRTFSHYSVLLGYNIFQGEIYPKDGKSTLTALYVVGGVGNVDFGGENNFSTIFGVGYKLGLTRRINLRLDFRSLVYESNLVAEGETSYNNQLTVGVGYLF
ncbi:MAG: outer membrane beta-barrel domain-containing protein [Alteromonadaceae bacterium]|nr:MAG: outer membrane beta-barrel domain-containing protein [Alteromonadaceae bacterium]